MEKTLLVTDSWNSSFLSDGLLKSQLAGSLPRQDLMVYLLDSVQDGLSENNLRQSGYAFQKEVVLRKSIKPPFFLRKIRFIFVYLQALWVCFIETRKSAKRISNYCEVNGYKRIWIIVQGPDLLWIAEWLMRMNNDRVFIQYSYSGSTWTKLERNDRVTDYLVEKSRRRVFSAAKNLAFESEKECTAYPRAQALLPSIHVSQTLVDVKKSDRFIIGVIGNVKGTDTFFSLVSALETAYWKIDGKDVEIHYWGYDELPLYRSRIIRKLERSPEQLVLDVKTCDVLYFPFSFGAKLSERVRVSVPYEMVWLAQISVPFFYHGPSYGYAAKWPQGISHICTSDDSEVIKMHLRKALLISPLTTDFYTDRTTKLNAIYGHNSRNALLEFLKLNQAESY